jgi:hypothetical protein
MVMQESLRVLLVLAIMDGILQGVSSRDDLLAFRLHASRARTGQRLLVKESMRQTPVLRRIDQKQIVTDLPSETRDFQVQLS